ncbi:MAG: hypothetical protein AAGB35_02295 [Pseudomonadota bacterium]
MRILLSLIIFAFFSSTVFADEWESARIELEAQKKIKIAQSLPLDDDESEAFWDVYNDYQNDQSKLMKQSFDLMKRYTDEYESNSISDQEAENMLAEYFRIEHKEIQLKESYLPKFQVIIPSKKVFLFYQLDNKIDALVRCDIAKQLPLIKTD